MRPDAAELWEAAEEVTDATSPDRAAMITVEARRTGSELLAFTTFWRWRFRRESTSWRLGSRHKG